MRRGVGSARLLKLTKRLGIKNSEFRLRGRGTRRLDFVSVLDSFNLPGIKRAAFQGLRRSPVVLAKLRTGRHQVKAFVVHLNAILFCPFQPRPAKSWTI